MPVFSKTQRLKTALGGFVSFTGLAVLACAILTITRTANLASVFQNGLSIAIVFTVGALNIASGLILILQNKEIALSFASN